GRVDLAAGKGDLAGMVVEMGGALRQQHRWLRVIDNRNQHRGGPYRLFARDDLEHPVGPGITARRNDIRIEQTGRNVEAQPRTGPVEELRRADLSGVCLHHWLVQSASRTSCASAIAKNSP